MLEDKDEGAQPKRDFAKMLDLDRSALVKTMVDRMEQCLRDIENAQGDLKEVVSQCVEAEFRKHDIAAMRKIAKLRLQDKRGDASEQLEALERIGRAVGFDLFDWASAKSH